MLFAMASAATAYHFAAKPAARAGLMSMSSEWAGDLSAEVETAVAAVQRAMQLWCAAHIEQALRNQTAPRSCLSADSLRQCAAASRLQQRAGVRHESGRRRRGQRQDDGCVRHHRGLPAGSKRNSRKPTAVYAHPLVRTTRRAKEQSLGYVGADARLQCRPRAAGTADACPREASGCQYSAVVVS